MNYFISNIIIIISSIIQLSQQQAIVCSAGTFYFELTDNCQNCYTGCNSCSGFHEKDCLDCSSGFEKIILDNQMICSKCSMSQFYDRASNSCLSCTSDCKMCFSQDTCSICQVGYVFDPKQSKCDLVLCSTAYFRDPMTQQCLPCDTNSLECYAESYYDDSGSLEGYDLFAVKCKDTYQLSDGYCSCNYGSYEDGSTCKPCSDVNCTYCSKKYCYTCKDGYYEQGGICVTLCDASLYFIQQSNSFQYTCSKYTDQTTVTYQLLTNSGTKYCNKYHAYTPGRGCFITKCRPFEFKLYDIKNNAYNCVKVCPIDYTVNLSTWTCLPNDCSNDITQLISNQCFYRTCSLGQYFQSYQELTKSKCVNNQSYCLNQYEESSSCIQCQPGYLFSYGSNSCTSYCSNLYYYTSGNSCSSCNFTTVASRNSCLANNQQLTFTGVGGQQQLGNSCAEGYYKQQSTCIRCADTKLILCDSQKQQLQYFCEWGQNNSVSSCDNYDLRLLANKGFDQQGNVVDLIASDCRVLNADNSCRICSSGYNINFRGVCSKAFKRSTKYYLYYNITDQQYLVVDKCTPTQYVQRISITSASMRVCKDFSYCLETTQQIIDAVVQTICKQCSPLFYNLNGNCLDTCPKYTFKNDILFLCQTPIDNCASYATSTDASALTTASCEQCKQGFVPIENNTKCIEVSTCQNGLFVNFTDFTCSKCSLGCAICDSTNRCLSAKQGYILHNFSTIIECPYGYVHDINANDCKMCNQFCANCSDQFTCTQPFPTSLYLLLDSKVFIYSTPICQVNQYYEETLNLCLPCDPSCSQCLGKSTFCLVCSNPKYSIYNNTCVQNCPKTYYSSSVVTAHYTRLFCKQCDSLCLDSDCLNEATFCNLGCVSGYYFYQNRCITQCPTDYEANAQKCQKICKQKEYNSDQDTCAVCKEECLECNKSDSCTQCQTPLILQKGSCVKSCDKQYFFNEITNECILCGNQKCSECRFVNNIGSCINCKVGYELNEDQKCVEIYIEDKPVTKEEQEEREFVNRPITYTGTIYEGSACHYSCKQCKGKGVEDCLSCHLSTRVLFQEKYCICIDGYKETGNQDRCVQDDSRFAYSLGILDTIANWCILVAVAFDHVPIITLTLIHILSLGSYSIYIETLYNCAGKLMSQQSLYSNNFSEMIPHFIRKSYYLKDVGVYKTKIIVEATRDQDRELPLIFNNVSNNYLLNSEPFLILLAISIVILLILKFKNEDRFQCFLNKYLIIFQYVTFQDQILFVSLQLKHIQYFSSSSALCISCLFGVTIGIMFNICMFSRAIMLQRQSYSIPNRYSHDFQKYFISQSYFIGLSAKLFNSLSVALINQEIRIYIFLANIVFSLGSNIYIAIRSLKIQSKLFFLLNFIIALELIIFVIPVLLNLPSLSESVQNDMNLHQLQAYLNCMLIFQKVGIFIIEIFFVVRKKILYKQKAGLISFVNNNQNNYKNNLTQLQTLQSQPIDLSNINIELILTNKAKKINWYQN